MRTPWRVPGVKETRFATLMCPSLGRCFEALGGRCCQTRFVLAQLPFTLFVVCLLAGPVSTALTMVLGAPPPPSNLSKLCAFEWLQSSSFW